MAKVSGNRLLVRRCIDIGNVLGSRECQGQDTNPPLTIAVGVKDSGLHAHHGLRDGLVDRDFNNIGLITWESWEGTQIRAAVEEVAIECVHPQTARRTDTEDSLQPNLGRQVVGEFACEFDGIFASSRIPPRVEVSLSTSVSRQVTQRRHILILGREQKHIH